LPVDAAVANSYQFCKKIACQSRSNFYWAFSLLRSEKQHGMYALYAFARLVDDWGDSLNTSNISAANWHSFVDQVAEEGVSDFVFADGDLSYQVKRIAPAVCDMIRRFQIPIRHLHEIVDGVAFDLQSEVFIQDEDELDRYCDLVASSVGQACLHIWGCHDPKASESAIACGRAFQLTNILRDVHEDAERGRVYIPRTRFESHRISVEDWKASHPSGDWTALIGALGSKAQNYYQTGYGVLHFLEPDGQRMLSLMWHTYSRLLDRILKNPSDVWKKRVRLSTLEKFQLYLQHAFSPCFSSVRRSPLKP
jgi:phytoene synthase